MDVGVEGLIDLPALLLQHRLVLQLSVLFLALLHEAHGGLLLVLLLLCEGDLLEFVAGILE